MNAHVTIRTAVQQEVTRLKESYFTPPFKVANITEDKKAPGLHLMLMSSSPGILDGDSYTIRLDMGEGSDLYLHTQSYQRLFDMKLGATQSMEVYMQPGSFFSYLPHPSVPHRGSIFKGRNRIFMQRDCRLVWGEVLTCGRKLSGETFAFSRYHSVTEIFLGEELVLRENILLLPAAMNLHHIGQLEGFTHQATLLLMGAGIATEAIRTMILGYTDGLEGVLVGVSSAPAGGIVVRLLGSKAEQLHHILRTIAGIVHPTKKTVYVR